MLSPPLPPPGVDLSFYHQTDTLLDALTRMAQPSRCSQRMVVENLRDADDPSFRMLVATFADSRALREEPSSAPGIHKPMRRVLLNFGSHGLELISSEVALRLARMLCGEAPSRFYGSAEASRVRIAELLRKVAVKMVPVQVPSSRRLAEAALGSCRERRLNARGVDINRNWDYAWAEGDAAVGSSTYRGPRPFSEPETRVLAELGRSWRPDAFFDVHSGDRFLAMPYASQLQGPRDSRQRLAMRSSMEAVVEMLRSQHGHLVRLGDTLQYGPAASLGEEPQLARGTALDYMFETVGVPRCFMFEIFGTSLTRGDDGAISAPPRSQVEITLRSSPATPQPLRSRVAHTNLFWASLSVALSVAGCSPCCLVLAYPPPLRDEISLETSLELLRSKPVPAERAR